MNRRDFLKGGAGGALMSACRMIREAGCRFGFTGDEVDGN